VLENCEEEIVEPTLDSNQKTQTSKHKRFLSFFAEEEGAA
jgi:hypothetical protein